jgi:hypothetical protein
MLGSERIPAASPRAADAAERGRLAGAPDARLTTARQEATSL